MEKRIPFPGVFWVANIIEVLERFAYYGIYMGMGIYMKNQLGLSMTELGNIQSYFLLVSYMVPVISGTFADKFGFKKVLIVSYLAYLPSILLLLITKTYSGMALTMLSIGLAAGIFKPLVSGTVRAVTDKTNATRGFGIFYAMVNVGGSFGPLVAGALRAIHWNYAFIAAAIAIVVMLLVTIFFFKEPEREKTEMSLGAKLREIGSTLADVKFSFFLIILGLFFWLPFWGFFNVIAMYVDMSLDTARLYQQLKGVIPDFLLNLISHQDKSSGTGPGGTWRIIGETIAHTIQGITLIYFWTFCGCHWLRFYCPGQYWQSGMDIFRNSSFCCWRNDLLTTDSGVYYIYCTQGEGRPLYGIKFSCGLYWRISCRQDIYTTLRYL